MLDSNQFGVLELAYSEEADLTLREGLWDGAPQAPGPWNHQPSDKPKFPHVACGQLVSIKTASSTTEMGSTSSMTSPCPSEILSDSEISGLIFPCRLQH
jgi:hypothetical protein